MRSCFFCSGDANSREDAWPIWMTRRFNCAEPVEMTAERRGAKLKSWYTRRPELAIRCVCKQCNNGWMGALQTAAKPYLEPMLDGRRMGLDMAAQTIITLWAMMTAMVLDGLDRKARIGYTRSERNQLRILSLIPSRTSVWLARAVESSHILTARTEHRTGNGDGGTSGCATTIVFGYLALQLLTIRLPGIVPVSTRVRTDVRRGPWDDSTVRIWPAMPDYVIWPPSTGVNGEIGLDCLAERFNTAELYRSSVEKLDV